MSVSDAAPLPRLGEVFFDVRGNSRSMRLSWYADTGVAVFSIWQAGMCTGTFRLPIADLGRMIELLQRGPAPRRRGPVPVGGAERGDRGFDRPSGDYRPADEEPGSGSGDDLADFVQGDFAADYGAAEYRSAGRHGAGAEQHQGYGSADEHAHGYGAPGYGVGEHPGSGQGAGGYQSGDPRGDGWADSGTRGYGADERVASAYGTDNWDRDYRDTRDREYADREYADRDYGAAAYGRSDPSQAGYPGAGQEAAYERGEHRTDGGYAAPNYEPADYWSRSADRGEPDYPSGDYPAGGFGAGRGADPGRDYRSGGSGHRDDRVVPPYVQGQEESYRNDNLAPGGGYQGDIGDPAYPADRRPVSPSHGYPEPPAAQDSYSHDSDYRYRLGADTGSDEGNSVSRSSGRRAG